MPNTDETNHKDSATSNKEKEKKHDSGSADLEKVTDFAEEKEIASSSAAEDAIQLINTKHNEEAEKRRAREIELAKVSIKKEDVDLIVEEMEISKTMAERTLREHAGNIVEALASLTN